jgi:hypothetical protein
MACVPVCIVAAPASDRKTAPAAGTEAFLEIAVMEFYLHADT